ncbi:MAG: hypothetical protein WA945_11290 [Arcobacteraceae bacterium]
MIYGTLILLFSMFLAIYIRLKTNNTSCFLKKTLSYIVLLFGGIIATYLVIAIK